ncbi:hypothetical protein WHI96_12110 [Pseudonocardia tropica]|uniref:Uncharacterized protein n=1 Tax=Pseudonocardia tropica TaxID=681289 RepID=A0ABV1JUE5_9PSEU
MSAALLILGLVIVLVLAAAVGYAAAEVSCRARWRRAARTGSIPLRARHAGPRRSGHGRR